MNIKLLDRYEGKSQKGNDYMTISCMYKDDRPRKDYLHAAEFFVSPDLREKARKLAVGKDFDGVLAYYSNAQHLVAIND